MSSSRRVGVERALSITMLVTVAIALVVVLFVSDSGSEVREQAFDLADSEDVPLFSLSSAAAITVLFTGLGLRRSEAGRWRRSILDGVMVALVLLLVVGIGTSFRLNALEAYSTDLPGDRSLAVRAAAEPNGRASTTWPFFIQLGEVADAGIVVPSLLFAPYIEEVAEERLILDREYDSEIDLSDPRLECEVVLQLEDGAQVLMILGRGDSYRLFSNQDDYFFISDPSC